MIKYLQFYSEFQLKCFVFIALSCQLFSCNSEKYANSEPSNQLITILGIAQDAGFPHINNPTEWKNYNSDKSKKSLVVSLGLIDKKFNQKWLFEATPDMPEQLHILENTWLKTETIIDGVFLTHAHIGHYTGLMYFGREAMGAQNIPVYVMPKMKSYLEQNGPWSQLVSLKNIQLRRLQKDSTIQLNSNLKVTPFLVPHRDEFSETVGFKIEGINKSALFIPDINKWDLWETSIVEEVKKVDYAFLDATFFKNGEIPRPMSEVPHPFIEETAKLFENESFETRSKIIFIHFNHSNPAIYPIHIMKDSLISKGFNFAKQGDTFGL
ncbi:MAG: MBL fold metallo-hydrolase [Flavobacteriaceae bacterium]|nr:MBL fold metallo-hydrolase [Flavobacteriaceae bacterium]